MSFDNLPHDWIATVCAGLGVFFATAVGLSILFRMWRQYEQSYITGAAVTMDAIYVSMPPQNIIYLGALCLLAVACVVMVLSGDIVVAFIFGLPGFMIPRLILWWLKRRRDRLFDLQLTDALMNISNSLRAGFSLPQALELVHREMPNPMSQEIRLVCQELRLGLPMDEALANLHKRMPLPAVDLVVTAISIVRDVGGNLTEVFDNIAHTIRERQRIEGKIRALTAQGKLQAIVICSLPFGVAIGLNVVAPEMINDLVSKPLGWAIIGTILVMEAIGAFFISKIVNIDV